MGTRSGGLVCLLTFTALVAACGDNPPYEPDAADCAPVDDGNECTDDLCTEDGQPVNRPRNEGAACGAGVCDADGDCVECVEDDDCTSPEVCDEASNACVAVTCTDGEENGDETDVDCGGSCAPGRRCGDTLGCAVPGDCQSGVCTGDVCQAPACGDGVRQGSEACDDGNHTNGDGCDDGAGGSCRPTGCGNGTVSGTEVCDDGNTTNGDGCDNNCTTTACGNGVIAGSETCDDSDAMPGDGCSATCIVEPGYTCTMVPSVCVATCGNGVVSAGEQCDDAPPAESGDGCSMTCTTEPGYTCTGSPSVCVTACGDGVRAPGEGCDDGDTTAGDGCNATCFVEPGWVCAGMPSACFPICGDGRVVPTEGCDDPAPAENGDGCSATCTVEPGYMCAGSPSTCIGVCGDGIVLAGEACDDPMPAESGDGCSLTCTVEPGYTCTGSPSTCSTTCGDGVPAGTEQCDDPSPAESGDGCSLTCTVEPNYTCSGTPSVCGPLCGDGVVLPGEPCDDAPPAEPGDGCSLTCTVEPGWNCSGSPSTCLFTCGNGSVDAGEQCDDGLLVNGDGCSSSCVIESGWTCTGAPSTCITTCGDGQVRGLEACDDAPPAENGDGCSATCTVEPAWQCTGSPSLCDGICGDLLLRGGEQCEDAPPAESGDGCSATCRVEPGWACMGLPATCATNCGDGITAGTEQCDDDNNLPVDGCSDTCTIEPNELEPNDDGVVATGAFGTAGNDFDTGGIAVGHANANGATDVVDGNTAIFGAISPAGDEDVFAITNSSTTGYIVRFDVWNTAAGFGVNVDCGTSIDTALNIRNNLAVVLATNDDRNGAIDRCSGMTINLPAGQTVYAHLLSYDDLNPIAGYALQIRPTAVICGDGVQSPGLEQCDDGNTVDNDGCSNTCIAAAVVEIEPNNSVTDAAASPLQLTGSTLIRAAIGTTTDVDVFRVDVATDGVLRFESYAAIPGDCTAATTVRLFDSSGVAIVSDFESAGIGACGALVFPTPAGIYYVQVEESGVNAAIAQYFLQVVYAADTGTESEPSGMTGINDTDGTASGNLSAATEGVVFGDHPVLADIDVYTITVPPGRSLRAEIVEGDRSAETCESLNVDSRLTLYAGAVEIADDDDSGRGWCSTIDGSGSAPLHAGARNSTSSAVTWHLHVRASSFADATGGVFLYRLQLSVR